MSKRSQGRSFSPSPKRGSGSVSSLFLFLVLSLFSLLFYFVFIFSLISPQHPFFFFQFFQEFSTPQSLWALAAEASEKGPRLRRMLSVTHVGPSEKKMTSKQLKRAISSGKHLSKRFLYFVYLLISFPFLSFSFSFPPSTTLPTRTTSPHLKPKPTAETQSMTASGPPSKKKKKPQEITLEDSGGILGKEGKEEGG